jgi:TfoX/Sxy family transcriptional regulator of competence genes
VAYDRELAERLREQLAQVENVTEKGMFGGLAFLINGNMAVSASRRGDLLVRVGPQHSEEALARPHTQQMESRGRPMSGWIWVAEEGLRTKRQLQPWVRRSVEFASSLPPKG